MANISEDAVKGYSPSDIIKAGITSYLQQNKNISVKDLLTKKSRQNAGNQLRSTLKSTTLDTGQNLINALRKEEVSRRKKPSAIRKKKALDAALEKLKKKRASLKEGQARFDKLVKAIRQSQTTTSQDVKLKKIANKVRGIREMVSKMRASDYRSPGKTIDVKAREKGGDITTRNSSIAKRDDKGSTLATRGTKNTEVKDKRKPNPYRSGEKKKFKGPSKERIGAIAKGVHSTVKKVGSSVSKAYGDSSWSGPRAG
tara:strand:+ start:36 stop:803 length:768 start_codon:yes stop_codon:yes gene_type:complete